MRTTLKSLALALFIIPTSLSAQFYWKLGGNNNLPPSAVNATNNVLGTNINLPIKIATNGTQRMHINQNTGLTNGFIGMGNGFNNPQSHLHINNPLNEETWLQITNVDVGETTTDGLKLGILDETPGQPSYGYLRWQENTPFIIQTQRTGSAGVINSERIRITTNQGNPDPFNPEGDNTRIGISNRGEEHITLIRSLLHLGYNTGFLINNINATDGWRSWMDVGTFTNNGRENMYVGLKQEAPEIIGLVPQPAARFDAIINWGDNEPVPSDGRYNNLRFIYTTPVTTSNNQPHTAWNGLETMRIEPTVASTLTAPNFGMVGIGDFSPEGPNTNGADVVNAKLDIDGDLRVRTVTQDNDLTQVLVIDPTDHNRVHWRDATNLTPNVTSDNGIFVNTSGVVQLGVPCLDVNGNINTAGILATQFTEDRVIANRDFNFWIGSLDTETGGVGFGGQPASTAFCNTGNTVEISANMKSTKYGNANASGLRLTQLTSASPTLANGTNGVNNTRALTVDQDGDVVLVDLSSLDTDTDQQTLSISGNTLSISNGNSVTLPVGTGGSVTANNGLKIFPVNSGNVQLGQANTGGTALTGGELLNDREIPLNGHSLFFSTNGRIGIGTLSNSKLTIRNDATTPWTNIAMLNNSSGLNRMKIADNGQTVFDVESNGTQSILFNSTVSGAGWNTNGNFVTTATSGAADAGGIVGVGATINGNTIAPHYAFSSTPHNYLGNNYGYYTLIRDNGGYMEGSNYGVLAWVSDGENNYGASFNARSGRTANYGVDIVAGTYGSDPDQDNAINYGVRASATGGTTSYGGRFSASGASGNNYGVYSGASGLVGATNWAGYFNGNVFISGSYGPSDIMLKDNVINFDNATELINQLQPKTFEYKHANFPTMNLSQGLQYGLIAQDVEAILPDLITEVTQPAELDSLGNVVTPEINFKGLEYQQLIPILIAGFKEQQSELDTKDSLIDNLQSEINYIKECLLNARICEEGNRTINQNPTTETNQKSIELINTNSIILDQNLPNPFAEHTIINYNIPDDVMEAKLMFYDFNGRIIKELVIEERGESKLTVYGTNLKTGVYTYSLIADGELIATKKMVKK